jgi:hypothetical protein
MKTAEGPAFPLAEVHEAARKRRVSIGGPSFKADLILYLGDYVRMTEFSEAVLLELREADFMRPLSYDGVAHDEYGVAISTALQKQFGVEGLETWYVKFTMDRDDDGGLVLMASLHKPKEPLRRVGGTLPIRFTRRRS